MSMGPQWSGKAEAEDIKAIKPESSLERMHRRIEESRVELAAKLWDYFEILDQMEEAEFVEVINAAINKTNGDGVLLSQLLEKFRKYKGA